MIKNFRLQLTVWYLLLFTLLFVGFSVFLYSVLSRSLYQRMDDTLSSEVTTAIGLFRGELREVHGDVPGAAGETMSEMSSGGVLVAVFEGNRLLASNVAFDSRDLLAIPAQAATSDTPQILTTVPHFGKGGSRVIAHRFSADGRQYVLLAAESLHSIKGDLRVVRRVLYLSLPLVLLVAGLGGFLLATKSLAPLHWMAEQARSITDKNLHSRLDIGAAHKRSEERR